MFVVYMVLLSKCNAPFFPCVPNFMYIYINTLLFLLLDLLYLYIGCAVFTYMPFFKVPQSLCFKGLLSYKRLPERFFHYFKTHFKKCAIAAYVQPCYTESINKNIWFHWGRGTMTHKFDKSGLRGKLFFRYLFSYLALVLIPLIIIGIFYSVSFNNAFRNEVFLNVDKDLGNVSSSMDSELSVFSNTVMQVSISSQLENMTDEFDQEHITELRQLLSNYNATNPFTQDIYLVLPDIGYVVTTTTSAEFKYFTNTLLSMEGISPAEMEAFFTSQTPDIIPTSILKRSGYQEERSLLFSYPVYNDYLRQIGTLIFQVPYSRVESLIHDKLVIYHAETFVFDQDFNLLADVGAKPDTTRKFSDIQHIGIQPSLERLSKEYITRSHSSPDNGFHYITLIPRDQQSFTQITRMNSLFLLAILIAAAISGIVIVYALRINYSPLRRLQNKAGKLINSGNSRNEISDIEDALETLSGQNLYLAARLEDNASSLKNMRLQKLLTNGYDSVEDFNLDCHELDMNLTGPNLFITTSYIHAAQVDLPEIGQIMKQFLSDTMQSYYLCPLETNKLIMVHSLSDQSLKAAPPFAETFAALHNRLTKIHDILLTTGVGSVVTGTTEISRSYLESSTALDYRYVKGNGQVIEFKELHFGEYEKLTYPQKHFEKLRNAIHANNESSIKQCIDEIIEIIDENNYPLSVARGICFNLINIATNTSADTSTGKPYLQPNLFALSEVDTIRDLVTILKHWRMELQTVTTDPKRRNETVTIAQVKEYLNEHCFECNFSIYETAEFFGMQLPKFSQYFKDQTNQNLMDYTIELRMNEASRLLLESTLDIKDIGLAVGYYNTSSFIRRFKQIQGITPGDYRKFIGKQKGEHQS